MPVPGPSPEDAPPRPPPRWATALVFAGFLALYLATYPTDSDGILLGSDATWYARNLAAGEVWHPHHLLFHLLAAAVAWTQALGGEVTVRSAINAQIVVASVGGAATVAIVFRLAARLVGSLRGFLAAAVLGVSAGTWFHAAVGETHLSATACLAALLATAVEMRLGLRPFRAPPLIGWFLLAVLMRQDSVLVVPALLVLLPLRSSVLVIGTTGALSLGAYFAAWLAADPPRGFAHWLTRLAEAGAWTDPPDGFGFFGLAGLTLASVVRALGYSTSLSWSFASGCAAVALFAAAPFVAFRVDGPIARAALGLGGYALARVLFFGWWQPSNVEFQGATWLPLVLIAVLLMRPAPARARLVAQASLLGVCALASASVNYGTLVGPNRGDSAARRAARAIELARPGGAVVAIDWLQEWALMRAAPPDVTTVSVRRGSPKLGRDAIRAAHANGARALVIRDDVVVARMLGKSTPVLPGLLSALLEGFEHETLERDVGGMPWLLEVLPRTE